MRALRTERLRRYAAAAVPVLAALSCVPFVEPLHTSNFATWALLLLLVADPAGARRIGAQFKPLWIGGLALYAASSFVAESPWRVAKGSGDVARGLLLALPVAWCVREQREAFAKLLAGTAALVVVGIGLYFVGTLYALPATAASWPPAGRELASVADPFVSANVAASALTGAMLLLLALLADKPWPRTLMAGVLLAGAGTALLLGSRGALLALCAALPLLFIARAPRGVALLYGAAVAGGIVVLAVLLLAPGASAELVQWLGKNGTLDNGRTAIYTQTLQAVAREPWLGWGINNFKVTGWDWVDGRHVGHPHAVWLELLFSLGVLGSAVFLALLVRVVRPLLANGDRHDPFLLAGLLLLAWLVVRGLFDLSLFHYATSATLGMALGLLAGARARAG